MAELDDKEAVDPNDAFSDENFKVIAFATWARIYDVLIALLRESNPQAAREILEVHFNGGLLGPSPNFSSEFATDRANIPPPA
jgi:hypothetical protein